MPSVVSVEQVRALVDSDLSDADLQAVIDREEAALAREIGPLVGPRTQTFYVSSRPDNYPQSLMLTRPTSAVSVTEAGTGMDPAKVVLRGAGYVVDRGTGTPPYLDGSHWAGPTVAVTYTPNDELEVERVVIELCRLTVTETGYLSETIGDYTYSRGARGGAINPTESARAKLIETLKPPVPAHTSRTLPVVTTTDVAPWLGNVNNPYA